MKDIIYLIRISAKYSFRILRKNSPFWSSELHNDIQVTSVFFNHITSNHKGRKIKDTLERLLLIPLIEDIIQEGSIIEERQIKEKRYFKVSKKISNKTFSIIILKKNAQYYLFSCFIDT